MNKSVKKVLASALSFAMIAGSVVLPMSASADYTPLVEGDTVLNEWNFGFGVALPAVEGNYPVGADDNFVENAGNEYQYGFLGTGEEDYKLTDRYDGWATQEGQVIELAVGENGGIGVVGAGGTEENEGADIYGNQADIYYPTRFALKVEDDTYYRVKATVTTLDPSKDATVSLYTERKHPLYTEKTLSAGETDTVTFSVRVTPIYYEKSSPTGAIADKMLTVGVLGENSALLSLQIQQVETIPTFWVLGDSTVTDGNTTLPYFPLQNYTGVGTGLTKYLPRDIAMVNEGEGGLNAADSLHFNMVSSRIKKGDYLYVEYGHNHKTDGAAGYKSCLDKYYNACHNVGAKLIIVSPIERINTFTNGEYQHSLRDFATTGAEYVDEKIKAGATDIAYVDLNEESLSFYNKITADNGNSANAIKFYFQTANGGGTDTTHPNDTGAENLAACFFNAAKKVTDATQVSVLSPILDNLTDETPNLVPESITSLGDAPNSAWPNYTPPVLYPYPAVIENVVFDESGNVSSVDVKTQPSSIVMDSYGIIVITVTDAGGTEKGKIYAQEQVDNSTGYGTQTITKFTSDVTLDETDTYSAVVMKAKDATDDEPLSVDEEANLAYSAVYKPTDIERVILTNEDKDGIEDFEYYGAVYSGESVSSLSDFNGWTSRGSAGKTLTLGEDGDEKYATIKSDGAKEGVSNQGSFYVAKDLDESIGITGRYVISADLKYVSGGGMETRFVTGNTEKVPWGTETLSLFTVASGGVVTANGVEIGAISASDFTNVKYILDIDCGKAYVSVGGSDEKVISLSNYDTTDLVIAPSVLTGFMFGGDKVAFEIQAANLTVAKLRDQELPKYTIQVKSPDTRKGTVSISYVTPEPEPTEAPVETTVPAETAEPEGTASPAETAEPEGTASPAETAEPKGTDSPDATAEPEGTALPDATTKPEGTASPAETAEPQGTASPNATAEPEGTIAPEMTVQSVNSDVLEAGENVVEPYAEGDTHTVTFTSNDENFNVEVYKDINKTEKVESPYIIKEDETWFFSINGLGNKIIKISADTSDENVLMDIVLNHRLKGITEDIIITVTVTGDEPTAQPGDMTLEYKNDMAVVTSCTDAIISAILIEVLYDGNGAVAGINTHNVNLKNSGDSEEFNVTEGSRIMLWNSLKDMEPIAEAIDAVILPVPEEKSETLPINTVVTASAEAKPGFVFMGWLDESGSVVSMDAEYTFRLRGDTTLTANFVKEPKIEETVSFSLEPVSPNIKMAAGASTEIKIANPVDKNGTPIFSLKNSDLTWTCAEEGITVSADGVVTISDAFSLGGALTKDVTVKGSINGIEKSCTITIFGYEYFENMAEGSTDYDGLFMTIAGKTAAVFPGGSTTQTYKMSESVTLDKATTITFDNAWSGSNTCGQTRTLNFIDSSGNTIFSMYYSWASLYVGSTELASAVSKDSWSTVKVEIDPATSVVTVTAGGNSETTTLAAGAADIAGIKFVSAASVPGPDQRALGISNVTIIK